jgi:hypothetical protein
MAGGFETNTAFTEGCAKVMVDIKRNSGRNRNEQLIISPELMNCLNPNKLFCNYLKENRMIIDLQDIEARKHVISGDENKNIYLLFDKKVLVWWIYPAA